MAVYWFRLPPDTHHWSSDGSTVACLRAQSRPSWIACRHSSYRSGVEHGKSASIVDECASNPEGGLPHVAGDMRPVGMAGRGFRRANVHMQIGAVRVLDQSSVEDGGTLVGGDLRLRMDAEVECVKVVDAIAKPIVQNNEKAAQRLGFVPTLNAENAVVTDG